MSFVFSPLIIAIGAVVLAGVLFALQQLKVRQRLVRLPAAALWIKAAGEAPARVMRQRFRYWLAYLVALVIVLLLWLAAAGPQLSPTAADRRHLFYLDTSAAMTAGDNAGQARRALIADVRAVPAARRAVYLGDATGALLLAPGENVALLAKRLNGVKAQARPSTFTDWMADGARHRDGALATVHYYGDWPAARAAAARPPQGVDLVFGYLAKPVAQNRAVVNLGVAPAASGAWDRADAWVEVMATDGKAPDLADLRFQRGGKDFQPSQIQALGEGRFVLRELEADGQPLRVALRRSDGFAADDSAVVAVPDRRPLRVAVTAGTPAVVREVVRLDSALELTDIGRAQVVVRLAGETAGANLPALVLSQAGPTQNAFVFSAPADDVQTDLSDNLDQMGLSQIDAGTLAERLNRPIAVDVIDAPRRQVAVWADLFADTTGFSKSRAMPVFVSQSLRWLAQPQPWIPYAQAGRNLVDQSGLYGLAQSPDLARRGLNGEVFLAQSGEQKIGDLVVPVSLVDGAQSRSVTEGAPASVRIAGRGRAPTDLIFALLILFAGLLLIAEWRLHQRGAMP